MSAKVSILYGLITTNKQVLQYQICLHIVPIGGRCGEHNVLLSSSWGSFENYSSEEEVVVVQLVAAFEVLVVERDFLRSIDCL